MEYKKELKIGLPNYDNLLIGCEGANNFTEVDDAIKAELLEKKDYICSLIGEKRWKNYYRLFER